MENHKLKLLQQRCSLLHVCVGVVWVVGNLMETTCECVGIKPIYILYVYMVWLEEVLWVVQAKLLAAPLTCVYNI